MERARTGAESEFLLGLSVHFLTLRDLAMPRLYALRARKSDPKLTSIADQILAVAEVLLATDSRLHNRHLDYYSILQIYRSDSGDSHLLRSKFEKLAAVLNTDVNKFLFSDYAFGLVRHAWAVLSDPGKRTRYENEIGEPEKSVENEEKKKENESESTHAFWTLCPYCYCMYEYDKVFEECCLRCQNCRRAFHGVPVDAPPESAVVEEGTGKRYYSCWGYFPLGNNKGAESCTIGVEVKNGGQGNVGIGGGREMRNVKIKAGRIKTNTKKLMGSGMRSRRNGIGGMDSNLECGEASGSGIGEGGLEFFEGDDDVFVGIVGTP